MIDDTDLLAGVEREFVGLAAPTAPRIQAGGHPCQGIHTRPKGRAPKTAFIATHDNVDFAEHCIASYLAARGYGFQPPDPRGDGRSAGRVGRRSALRAPSRPAARQIEHG